MDASSDAVAAAAGVLDGGGGTIGRGGATIDAGAGLWSEGLAAARGTTGVAACCCLSTPGPVDARDGVVPTHDGRPQVTPKPV